MKTQSSRWRNSTTCVLWLGSLLRSVKQTTARRDGSNTEREAWASLHPMYWKTTAPFSSLSMVFNFVFQIRTSWPVWTYLAPIIILTTLYNLPRFWELKVKFKILFCCKTLKDSENFRHLHQLQTTNLIFSLSLSIHIQDWFTRAYCISQPGIFINNQHNKS